MSIRYWIAKKLAPDIAKDAKKYHYLRTKLDEARTWLGYDFPEVDAAIFWALVSEVNHFRSIENDAISPVPSKPWIYNINDFREHLRKEAKDKDPEKETVIKNLEAEARWLAANMELDGDKKGAEIVLKLREALLKSRMN